MDPYDSGSREYIAASTYDTIPEPIIIIQENGIISQANRAAGLFANMRPEAMIGLSSHALFHHARTPIEECPVCSRLCEDPEPFSITIDRGDGCWVECSITPISLTNAQGIWVQVIRDISLSVQTQKKNRQLTYLYKMLFTTSRAALRSQNAQELLDSLFDTMREHSGFDVLFIACTNKNKLPMQIQHLHGLSDQERPNLEQALTDPGSSIASCLPGLKPGQVVELFQQYPRLSDSWTNYLRKRGIHNGFLIPLFRNESLYGLIGLFGKDTCLDGMEEGVLLNQISEDTSFTLSGFASTERRLNAEKNTTLSDLRFSEVFRAAPLPLQIMSATTRKTKNVNAAFETWSGYSLADLGSDDRAIQQFLGDEELALTPWWEFGSHDALTPHEMTVYDKQGNPRIARLTVLQLNDEVILNWVDLTAIRKNEAALRESEKHFRAIIEQTVVGIYICDEHEFIYANPRFCEIIGLPAEQLIGKNLADIAGQNEASQNLIMQKWTELQKNQSSMSYSLPIRKQDGTHIVLDLHGTCITWDGKPAILALAQDITERERNLQQISQYVVELKQSIKGTFDAVSKMVEIRDPYTAGHEHRVGLIARLIGKEMGWPEDRCDSVELIGLVHDIGKIGIPSEILTKPLRLSDIENSLLREHARIGYEILKDVYFEAAPVAEVIWQHHERLDGSGYPRGLRGDEILPEARVIAVADVLESMSSHRPYRKALGMDAALNELRRGRGTLYDPVVVDTALRLFVDQGLTLPR